MRCLTMLGVALPLMTMAACKDSIGPVPSDGLPAPVVSSRGEVLARSTCASCHGAAFGGNDNSGPNAPNLQLIGGYTEAEFDRLLCTGATRSGESVDSSMVALRFGELPEDDRWALYSYLYGYFAQPTK